MKYLTVYKGKSVVMRGAFWISGVVLHQISYLVIMKVHTVGSILGLETMIMRGC